MALPVIPTPPYPNVPQAAGVPPVARQQGTTASTLPLLIADAIQIASLFLAPKWGLFDDGGNPVIVSNSLNIPSALGTAATALGLSVLVADPSVVGLDFAKDNAISTAPREASSFLSYNKVFNPFRARLNFVMGGSEASRSAFLQSVMAAEESLDLYTLVMPEYSYENVNVTHYDFRRSSHSGLTLLTIEVWVEEVRIVGTSQFSSVATKAPSGASSTNGGSVQSIQVNPNGLPAGAPT